MKRTALILAGAAVFDLGVMAVAAQAQQRTQTPPVRSGPTASGPPSPGPMPGVAVQDPTGPGGTGGCIPTPGRPGTGGTANPCAPGVIAETTDHKHRETIFIKVDQVNTIQACTARGGEVVRREGVRQCRIPPAPTVGDSIRRPGGIPPHH